MSAFGGVGGVGGGVLMVVLIRRDEMEKMRTTAVVRKGLKV
jgi:membrane associated rhomboid family serine protease